MQRPSNMPQVLISKPNEDNAAVDLPWSTLIWLEWSKTSGDMTSFYEIDLWKETFYTTVLTLSAHTDRGYMGKSLKRFKYGVYI